MPFTKSSFFMPKQKVSGGVIFADHFVSNLFGLILKRTRHFPTNVKGRQLSGKAGVNKLFWSYSNSTDVTSEAAIVRFHKRAACVINTEDNLWNVWFNKKCITLLNKLHKASYERKECNFIQKLLIKSKNVLNFY